MQNSSSAVSHITKLPNASIRCLGRNLRWTSVIMCLVAAPALADPVFTIPIPLGVEETGPALRLTVPAVYPDTNANGVVSHAEAIHYAELCKDVTLLSGTIDLMSPMDDNEDFKRRRAVAVTNAILRLHNRPQDFLIPSGYPNLTVPGPVGLVQPLSFSELIQEPSPTSPTNGHPLNAVAVNQTECSGSLSIASTVAQHLFGTSLEQTALVMIVRPEPINVDPLNTPIEPSTPVPAEFVNPCADPSPETGPMPNGDGPAFCNGTVKFVPGGGWRNPCDGTFIPGGLSGLGIPDVIQCYGSCTPPTVDPGASGDHNFPVGPPSCASMNTCSVDCTTLSCGPSDPPIEPPAHEICSGSHCQVSPDPTGPGFNVPDPGMDPDGIFRPPFDPTPKEKDPIILCGGTLGAASASTSPNGINTCRPVDLVTGDKMETDTDLVLPLNGRSFNFSRFYSTNEAEHERNEILGTGWSSPLFREMHVKTSGSTTYLELRGARANQFTRFDEVGGVFRPLGPSRNYADNSNSTYLRYYEPGVGTTEFWKTGNRAGKIHQQVDEHGNVWRFEYRNFHVNGSPTDAARLHRIYLNETAPETDPGVCEAVIEFGYYLVEDSITSAQRGKLARVLAYRFVIDESDPPAVRRELEVARLEFTYKHESDPFSSDVGTNGDLIQVVKYSRVDRAPDDGYGSGAQPRTFGPGYPHRASVVQYRYHNGQEREVSAEQHQSTRPKITGAASMLKSVFRPQQLEHYAELLYRGNSDFAGKSFAVRDAAFRLMLLPDRSLAVKRGDEEYRVDEIASKIVGYDGNNKVAVQYLQSGCGCGGAVQAVKEVFTRAAYTAGPQWKSTKLVTLTKSGSSWAPYTTRWTDSKQIVIGDSSPYMLVYDVLEDDTTTARQWITEYKYDGDRRLIETISPAAYAGRAYTPNSGTTAPSLSGPPITGSASFYDYNPDNRITEMGVRTYDAGSPTDHLMVQVEYGDGTGNTRKHLPISVTRHTGVGSDPDNKEVTTFAYTFWAETGDGPSAIQSVSTTVERETVAENGPSASEQMTTTQLFDQRGRLAHTISAAGVATEFAYGDPIYPSTAGWDSSGRPWYIAVNSVVGPAFSSFTGLLVPNDQPTIVSTIERDALGRVRHTTVQGPNGSISSEWVYESQPIPSDSSQPTGVQRMMYSEFPARLFDGSYAGPATRTWVDAHENSLYSERLTQQYVAGEDALALNILNSTQRALFHGHVDARIGSPRTLQNKRAMKLSLSGLVAEQTGWYDAAETVRAEGDRSYTEKFEYDQFGRRTRHTSVQGTITEDKYDCRGRMIERWYGRAGAALTKAAEFFYDSGGAANHNGVGNGLLTLAQGHAGEGPTSGQRDRTYKYDARDRLISVQNPTPPHLLYVYDNLDRVIERAEFTGATPPSSMTATGRGSYSRTYYGQRGLVYKTAVAIDPTNDGAGFLESHVWRDNLGRVIASWGPDSPASKVEYDALGRVVRTYVTDRAGDAAPGASGNYAHAASVSDDTVLEQTESKYAEWGGLSMTTHLVRRHDAAVAGETSPKVGPLSAIPTGSAPYDVDEAATGIATYTGYVYDDAGRPIRTVAFGTNRAPGSDRLDDSFCNGSEPTWPPAEMPEWDDDDWKNQIVTAVRYGPRGTVEESIDPLGRVTRVIYDDLDRAIATIENFTGGSTPPTVTWHDTEKRWEISPSAGVGSIAADQNRVTWSAHFKSGDDWIVRQGAQGSTALDGTGTLLTQMTDTVLGVDKFTGGGSVGHTDSLVGSGEWAREMRTPNPATGVPSTNPADVIKYAYNALGEIRGVKDQNQTVHRYSRDAQGRVIRDDVASFGGNVDDAISVIEASYDTLGRVTDTQTLTALGGTVKSHVNFSYSSLGLLQSITQDPDSAIGVAGHPARTVAYAYDIAKFDPTAAGYGNRARAVRMDYPIIAGTNFVQTQLKYHFGVPSGTGSLNPELNDRIGRVTALTAEETFASTPPVLTTLPDPLEIAEYSFVGLGMISHVDLGKIDAQLDRTIDATGRRNYGAIANLNTQVIGAYPGWDRFGRVKRHAWVRSIYNVIGASASGGGTLGTTPANREYSNFAYGYDRAGNPTYKQNARLGAGFNGRWVDRDYEYHHDGLDRLTLARRGVLGGISTTLAPMAIDGSLTPAGVLSSRGGSQKWTFDPLGNWTSWGVDQKSTMASLTPNAAADGSNFDPAYEVQTRTHNQQNEMVASGGGVGLTQPSVPADADYWHRTPLVPPFGYAHDDNGSRTQIDRVDSGGDGVRHKLTYDAWNRLVKIEKAAVNDGTTDSYALLAEYTYNGLHWRTSKSYPTEIKVSGTPRPATAKRWFTYNAAWQCITEEIDDDSGLTTTYGEHVGTDRVTQQIFGLRGINDALYRREDRFWILPPQLTGYDEQTEEEEYSDPLPKPLDGIFDNSAIYQLSDAQFSVISVVAAAEAGTGPGQIQGPPYTWLHKNGSTIETTEYEPYGRNRRIDVADVYLDGITSGEDYYQFMNAYFAGNPAADLNDDGTVTIDDLFMFFNVNYVGVADHPDAVVGSKDWGGGAGVIDNPYGYCGYYADMETLGINGQWNGFLYHVRHRVYDPIAGRWLQRDPAGFVDGMNLYEYCGGGSVSCFDPMGLCADQWDPVKDYQDAKKNKDGSEPIITPNDKQDIERNRQANERLDRETDAMGKAIGAAAEGAASMVPGVGEVQDFRALVAKDTSFWGRVIAIASLGVSAVTLGVTPNFGGSAKAAANASDAAADAKKAAQGAEATADAASGARAAAKTPPPLRYKLGPNDADWRGTGKTHNDAIEEAFRKTGVPKGEFTVNKWAKDGHGKSHPVEWRGPDGAEVNIDLAHAPHGPDAPHVGWQSPGKRTPSGGGARGHIILDDVPYNRE